MQSVCFSGHLRNLSQPSSSSSFQNKRKSSQHIPPPSLPIVCLGNAWWRNRRVGFGCAVKCHGIRVSPPSEPSPEERKGISYLPISDTVAVAAAGRPDSSIGPSSGSPGKISLEPFRGKSGSVSFYGLTYQLLEERKLVSSPFKEGTGSLLWVLGPLALISSLLLPQIFLSNAIEAVLKDEVLAEIVASFSSEVLFYGGLATFLLVTDHVQRPYLEFSPKRWGLITGLRGYLYSAFFSMGVKVFVPLLAAYVVWPVIGLPALVAVAPFLLGCGAQFAFEVYVDKCNSSCWPLLPIIFEVYRLYQLNKGAHFIERLMFIMRGSAMTPELFERSGALVALLVVFQVLGLVCLWSLLTFLLRLFPSRPVVEKY